MLPIEIKSGNGISIPKIFYSFADEYPQTKRFIKTTKGISAVKKLGKEKEVIFTPNWNVSNVL
ncbi:MAG: hypothetical protein LBO09_06385 [Candidatus Peribacteria bacterium]|nr:hypothetical protein [Candidatus Peribacteria bacterium]